MEVDMDFGDLVDLMGDADARGASSPADALGASRCHRGPCGFSFLAGLRNLVILVNIDSVSHVFICSQFTQGLPHRPVCMHLFIWRVATALWMV